MSKGSKDYIMYTIYMYLMLCRKGRKIILYVETRERHIFAHNFLNIQLIFNPQKCFRKLRLRPSQPYHPIYVCQSMLKGSKVKITFNPFNIHSIGWYGWKGLSLSFPKLFAELFGGTSNLLCLN